MTAWTSIVLAAGKGTRMKSDLAKVLHPLEGMSLLGHVLETARQLPIERHVVVVGHQAEAVKETHAAPDVDFALQKPQLGTGHAVICGRPYLEGRDGSVIVLYGDVPLLRAATLDSLMERHRLEGNGATVLTARLDDPKGYGRIVRGEDGGFRRIVEDKDLDDAQRSIDEINSGIYTFEMPALLQALDKLRNDNAQGEYYLTDTLESIREDGAPVGVFQLDDRDEISGINTVEQLEDAARVLRKRRDAGEGARGCELCDSQGRDPWLIRRADGFVVTLDPRPYNCGQIRIAPERHVVSFAALTAEEQETMLRLGKDAERWIDEAFSPAGFNLGYNSGDGSRHLALQVIPRWAGDANFMLLVGGTNLLPEELKETHRRICAVAEGAS